MSDKRSKGLPMKFQHGKFHLQRGVVKQLLLIIIAVSAVSVLWLFLDEDAGKGLKKTQSWLPSVQLVKLQPDVWVSIRERQHTVVQ